MVESSVLLFVYTIVMITIFTMYLILQMWWVSLNRWPYINVSLKMCNYKKIKCCFDAGVSVLSMPQLLKHYEVYETIGSGNVHWLCFYCNVCNALVIVHMRNFHQEHILFYSVLTHRWLCQSQTWYTHTDGRESGHQNNGEERLRGKIFFFRVILLLDGIRC